MWNDNESEIDLLGFEHLVDSLEIILTDERLLPVTVGVTGDWGSGKSSLMGMARARLDQIEGPGYVTVSFSPWRFEGYEDVKSALIETVLEALEERIDSDDDLKERLGGKVRALRAKLHEWKVLGHLARGGVMLAGGGAEEVAAAGAAGDVLGEAAAPGETGNEKAPKSFKAIAEFHTAFEELIDELGEAVTAVVVFIDDVDRCSAKAIVETFEAIRLFLHAPKTAYVVGANEQIVESALSGSLPARAHEDPLLGRNYLEKMLQMTVVVPPLSEPEVLTYVSLLFAEREASPAEFEALLASAAEQRKEDQLGIAMNLGIATAALDSVSDQLAASLELSSRIGSPLARGLRGNPRQIKRFLNSFALRQKVSSRRGVDLNPGILAKLMVLEFTRTSDFERIFQWQLGSAGPIVQLEVAEKLALGEEPGDDEELNTWAAHPDVRRWLTLSPPLAGEDLRPYFTLARDRLSKSILTSVLPTKLQKLANALQAELEPTRKAAVKELVALEQNEFLEAFPIVLEIASDSPGGEAMKSAVEASSRAEAKTALLVALDTLNPKKVPPTLAFHLQLELGGDTEVESLFDRWIQDGNAPLKKAIANIRKS